MKLPDGLTEAPELYDFFAVMRMLEAAHPERPRIGDSATLRSEYVSLGQDPFLIFPASNISKAELGRAGRLRLAVRFLGQLGPQGALPLATTDEANSYVLRGDDAFARFVDLFNNRFLQLFYRAWADVRPIAQADRPLEDRFRAYLGSSIGLGTPNTGGLGTIPDALKLHFAGLMSAQAKSASRLTSLISGVFGIRCEVEEFIGSWQTLEPTDRSSLGGANAGLGTTLMLGSRTYSVSDKFRIRLFTATLAEYETYLPGQPRADHLDDIVSFYLGEELEWDVELAIPSGQVAPVTLGRAGRLGWTSWMAPDWAEADSALRTDARFDVHERAKRQGDAANP
ncbi:type VI secretion system baseplate subunit TssG [Phreatobacter stygius]|uniref:type VI secretion system baseplate subunit TssG n=1 Tax=Phreatobacter stygius TaxID=1940610 RepID=UPI001FE832E0|nr:type VI secretion system baseplate subunit TssG [Phreatobacter stygius]